MNAGIIESIKLTNFMCHPCREIKFTAGAAQESNVSFITGPNGSGKSAILAGLVIALGASSRASNRGKTLAQYIKDTNDVAKIEVVINNRGPDAFRRRMYGDSIRVVRTISAKHTAKPYTVFNHFNERVADHKAELTAIKDALNIQVDNPVSVLTQDASRTFLSELNPRKFYQFFGQTTQLDSLVKELHKIEEEIDEAKRTLVTRKQGEKDLKSELRKIQKEKEEHETLQKFKVQLGELQSKMLYKEADELKLYVDGMRDRIEAREAEITECQRKIDSEKEDKNAFDAKLRELRKASEVLVEELKPLSVTLKQMLEGRPPIQREMTDLGAKIRSKEQQIAENKRELNSFQDALVEKQKNSSDEQSGRIIELQTEMRSNEEKIQQLKEEFQTMQRSQNEFRERQARAEQEMQDKDHERRAAAAKCQDIKRGIEHLENSRGNRILRFGRGMDVVVQLMEEAARKGVFGKTPKGPMGIYVEPTDERWQTAVEVCLGRQLHTFLVDSFQDQLKLKEVFAAAKRRVPDLHIPPILVSSFQDQPYNITETRLKSHTCVLDKIRITDVVVSNALIDARHIETIMLASTEELRTVMNKPPPNCNEGFAPNGDQVIATPIFKYYPCKNFRGGMLSQRVDGDVTRLTTALAAAEAELAAVTQQQREASDSLAAIRAEPAARGHVRTGQIREEMEALKRGNRRLEMTMNDLQATSSDSVGLLEDIAHSREQVTRFELERDNLTADMDALQRRADTLEKEIKEVQDRHGAKRSEAVAARDKVTKLSTAKSLHQDEAERAKAEKDQAVQKVREYREKIVENEAKIAKIHEDGVRRGFTPPEHPVREPLERLQKLFAAKSKVVMENKAKMADYDAVLRTWKEKDGRLREVKAEITACESALQNLRHDLERRHERATQMRAELALQVKDRFQAHLQKRDFAGNLHFNDELAEIHFEITKTGSGQTQGEEEHRAKDLKSLSGGERSFVTVCFILALWEAVDVPFRCMDEFDVFMDHLNRSFAIDMLLDFAAEQKQRSRQFIFLTPLDTTAVCRDRDLHVFRLPDPRLAQKRRRDNRDEEDDVE